MARYVWASPNTLLGLVFGLFVLAFGGRLRVASGVVEISGGGVGRLVAALRPAFPFRAITFGHVILGVSAADLDDVREHEHVHVAQYERWGPAFLFAYVASSAWQLLRGRRVYRDNSFEREAYGRSRHA